MSYGVTEEGFVLKRLPDIMTALEASLRAALGDMNFNADSVMGQIDGVFSKASADVWEAIQATYNAGYPSTATGISLDHAVELTGVHRLDATATEVLLWLTGNDGTTVPQGSQVRVTETGAVFELVENVVISKTTALRAVIAFNTTTTNTYEVRVNQDAATVVYTTGNLFALLAAAINALDHPVTATVVDSTIVLTADDSETVFNVFTNSLMAIASVVTPATAESTVTGPVLALAETVDELLTPVSGWSAATNPDDGILGRNVETDVELRQRRRESLRIIGAASVEAIRSRMRQEIESVQSVVIFENRQPTTVDGRPSHSFEAVVQGGDDADIANMLWQLKPAGIQTYGNTTVVITDSQGDDQAIQFSRPVEVPVIVVATVQIDLARFPAIGASMVRDAIVAFGNTLAVGEDVSVQRFYCDIFALPGVLAISMTVQREGEPGTLDEYSLEIGEVEIAIFENANVTVNPTTGGLG